MDLARMRRNGFTATTLGWVEHYGLNDQDSMLAYAGPERAVLDPRWNALPSSRMSTTRASSTGPASASRGSPP
jgi:hypothetical protein